MGPGPLAVGDEVAVVARGGFGRGVWIRKVSRVLKRFVELDDGTQWSHNGQPYPREHYSTRRLRPVSGALRAEARRQRVIAILESTRSAQDPTRPKGQGHDPWEIHSTEALERALDALRGDTPTPEVPGG